MRQQRVKLLIMCMYTETEYLPITILNPDTIRDKTKIMREWVHESNFLKKK